MKRRVGTMYYIGHELAVVYSVEAQSEVTGKYKLDQVPLSLIV